MKSSPNNFLNFNRCLPALQYRIQHHCSLFISVSSFFASASSFGTSALSSASSAAGLSPSLSASDIGSFFGGSSFFGAGVLKMASVSDLRLFWWAITPSIPYAGSSWGYLAALSAATLSIKSWAFWTLRVIVDFWSSVRCSISLTLFVMFYKMFSNCLKYWSISE